jgi:RND family efflux transporter MFP subunit
MILRNHRLLTAISLSGAVLLGGCTQEHIQDPRVEDPLVRIARVVPAPGSDQSFVGVVSARVESNLGFRVPGKVTERLVDSGQFVHRGQPLMRIDRTDYVNTVNARTETVLAAKVRADQTAADEARYRGLVKTGAASATTYDQMKEEAESAQHQLAVAQAQAQVAKDEVDYTTLTADSDGVIVETLAEPGQVVTAGQTVLRLAHAGPREASINLPETAERPRIGSMVEASLYSRPGMRFAAHLRQLSDAADPQSRTFEARYILSGEAADAPLGETVTIHLADGQAGPDTQVPLAAVFDPGSGPGVWILNHQKSSVSFHKVHLLQIGSETATVGDGLRVGDEIVALAPHLLHEGQTVRVETAKAAIQ